MVLGAITFFWLVIPLISLVFNSDGKSDWALILWVTATLLGINAFGLILALHKDSQKLSIILIIVV